MLQGEEGGGAVDSVKPSAVSMCVQGSIDTLNMHSRDHYCRRQQPAAEMFGEIKLFG